MPAIDLSAYPTPQRPKKNTNGGLFDFLHKEITFGNNQFPDKKKESFYSEICTLLLSGIDLRTALELVVAGIDRPADKTLLDKIRRYVVSGSALSDALRNTGKFGNYEYFSIRIGEETGQLGEVMAGLALYYKTRIQQRRKIVSAVSYPIIVLCTSAGAVFFMLRFVVPMFADVFIRFGGELPWITSVIIRISGFLGASLPYFFLLMISMFLFGYLNQKKSWYRKFVSAALLRIPVAGNLIRKIYLARFANTMRLLVSTDTPLLHAIALVRQMIHFYPVEQSLLEVEQDLLRGNSLHQSLARYPFYPPKLVQLVKVGEEVNRLDHFFEKIASQYTEEVEYQTQTISSVLEPLIIIVLGVVVGAILIAMYLPMFQLSNSF